MERDVLAIQRAQLADMPWDVVEVWLMEQGYVIVSREWHRRVVMGRAPIDVRAEPAQRYHLSWCACETCKRVRAEVLAEGERRDGE